MQQETPLDNLIESLGTINLSTPSSRLNGKSLEAIAKYIQSSKVTKIIVMSGAGISTSAGIPDFRTKGTGLYDNLQKYKLPYPEAVFDIQYFKKNPHPFFTLASEMFPGKFKPTLTHFFIKILAEKGMLLRAYTQNIDTLERVAGLDEDLLVEAHGSFSKASCVGKLDLHDEHNVKNNNIVNDDDSIQSNEIVQEKVVELTTCSTEHSIENSENGIVNEINAGSSVVSIPDDEKGNSLAPAPADHSSPVQEPETNRVEDSDSDSSQESDINLRYSEGCGSQYTQQWLKQILTEKKVPICLECGGLVKPDITFFGESLPQRFHENIENDFKQCELLIVMGTSLQVQPFASLIDYVDEKVPRLLINQQLVGEVRDGSRGFDFRWKTQKTDVFYPSNCDDGCLNLADLLGFKQELLEMHKDFSFD